MAALDKQPPPHLGHYFSWLTGAGRLTDVAWRWGRRISSPLLSSVVCQAAGGVTTHGQLPCHACALRQMPFRL
ncbi:hypothetical protein M406DRAFT_354738 [Cryphonectria parasitica EP155]|uniref:Uncharacterized protein n=1 Tax=Cryphonectria parasitica (strain ATCC 38755 / EP155) TaxID=660469 RepID=A0A9P4YCX5_CRYP1|nr:uncharacterized protein M406DRAFT_354738 [Cryphonectria parasitica EP155]KAF3771219.1 hypothetical protein M406DRAFT_354738 [Cryphonectria parasitica EP155]